MASYRLTLAAEADLIRIHNTGLRKFGEVQADKYFAALVKRFDEIVEQPYLYQSVDNIRDGYRRSVCGADSIYYRVDGNGVEIMAIIGQQGTSHWK